MDPIAIVDPKEVVSVAWEVGDIPESQRESVVEAIRELRAKEKASRESLEQWCIDNVREAVTEAFRTITLHADENKDEVLLTIQSAFEYETVEGYRDMFHATFSLRGCLLEWLRGYDHVPDPSDGQKEDLRNRLAALESVLDECRRAVKAECDR
jgi:hypothetical protein